MRSPYRTPAFVAGTLTIVVASIALGAFVHPMRYHFERVGATLLRVDTWDGTAKVLDPDKGWVPIAEPAPAWRLGWRLVRDSTLVTDSMLKAQTAPPP